MTRRAASSPVGDPEAESVTFLFTDIVQSSRLWEQYPNAMGDALARHDGLLRSAIGNHGGTIFKAVGDGFYAVFETPSEAVDAALEAQLALRNTDWADVDGMEVRMAIHAGSAQRRGGDYFGGTLNRCARLLEVTHGAQVTMSAAIAKQIPDGPARGIGAMDLGDHLLRGLTSPERIYQLTHPKLRANFPPLLSTAVSRTNLPMELDPFIGRSHELDQISSLLSAHRLVTLTGPGGVGKTRLAFRAAAEVLDRFEDGAWVALLDHVSDPSLVPAAVARAVGLSPQSGVPIIDVLRNALRTRSLLLILDNCEHLLEACIDIVHDLLTTAPDLTVMVTSREPLRIPGEVTMTISGLSLTDGPPEIHDPMRSEAVQLFATRAAAANTRFALNDETAQIALNLCRRLDGLPLAIELAAARTRMLSVDEIDRRLEDRFRLLTTGAHTALPRHQTLEAAIKWSYDLLDEEDQLAFNRLSVLAQSFDLEAAEAVIADGTIPGSSVIEAVGRLVEKSLLVAEPSRDRMRYLMLESLRQFSHRRYFPTPDAAVVRDRHATYFADLAEDGDRHLRGAEQVEWLRRLDDNRTNIRIALARLTEQEHVADAISMAISLRRFQEMRGRWSEGQRALEAILRFVDEDHPQRYLILLDLGDLAVKSGVPDAQAVSSLETALRDAEKHHDQLGIARCLILLGAIAGHTGDLERAEALQRRGLRHLRELDADWEIASTLLEMAETTYLIRGPDSATGLLTESLDRFRGLGDRRGIASALSYLGDIQRKQGSCREALVLLEEGIELSRDLGDLGSVVGSVSSMHIWLGRAQLQLARYTHARASFTEGLAGYRRIGNRLGAAWALSNLGMADIEMGELERAENTTNECLDLMESIEHAGGVAWAHYNLARIARLRGDHDRACTEAETALGSAITQRDRGGEATIRGLLGRIKHDGRRDLEARRLTVDAIVALHDLRELPSIAACLETLAAVERGLSQPASAAGFLGAAEALREQAEIPRPASDGTFHTSLVDDLQRGLGVETFAAERTAGRSLEIAAVVEAARTTLEGETIHASEPERPRQ